MRKLLFMTAFYNEMVAHMIRVMKYDSLNMTHVTAYYKNERVSRVNQFGQNSTVVYREKLIRLDPENSGPRSQ